MNVVGHKAVGVDLHAIDFLEFRKRFQILLKIIRYCKNDLSIVPSLHYVMWIVRKHDTPNPWHNFLPGLYASYFF
jgi:hypothetical protein